MGTVEVTFQLTPNAIPHTDSWDESTWAVSEFGLAVERDGEVVARYAPGVWRKVWELDD